MTARSPSSGFSDLASIRGELRGYRWWRVGLRGGLQSPWYGQVDWTPDENKAGCLQQATPAPPIWAGLFARYVRSAPHDTPSPESACGCGFYGMWDVPDGEPSTPEGGHVWAWDVSADFSRCIEPGDVVLGIAEAWGHLLLGTKGWRSEFARPLALYIPFGKANEILLNWLRRAYPRLAVVHALEALREFKPERPR